MGKTSYQDSPSDYSDSESSSPDTEKATNHVLDKTVKKNTVPSSIFSDQDSPSLLKNYVRYGRTNRKVNDNQFHKNSLTNQTLSSQRRINSIKEQSTRTSIQLNDSEKSAQIRKDTSSRKEGPKKNQRHERMQILAKDHNGRNEWRKTKDASTNNTRLQDLNQLSYREMSSNDENSIQSLKTGSQRNSELTPFGSDQMSRVESSKRKIDGLTQRGRNEKRKVIENYTVHRSPDSNRSKDVYLFRGSSVDYSDVYGENNLLLFGKNSKFTNNNMSKRKGGKVEMSKFVMNASRNPGSSDEDEIKTKKPAYHVQKSKYSNLPDSSEKKQNKDVMRTLDDSKFTFSETIISPTPTNMNRRGKENDNVVKLKGTKTVNTKGGRKNMDRDNSNLQSIQTKEGLRKPKKCQRHPILSNDRDYYTDNINSDSLHAESDYGSQDSEENTMNRLMPGYPKKALSPLHKKGRRSARELEMLNAKSNDELERDIYGNVSHQEMNEKSPSPQSSQKKSVNRAKAKKSGKSDSTRKTNYDKWLDKDLFIFLDTVEETPDKEMTAKSLKWVMFAKRLKDNGVEKTNEQCRLQVLYYLAQAQKSWVKIRF